MAYHVEKRLQERFGVIVAVNDNSIAGATMLTVSGEILLSASVAREGRIVSRWSDTYETVEQGAADFENWLIDYEKIQED